MTDITEAHNEVEQEQLKAIKRISNLPGAGASVIITAFEHAGERYFAGTTNGNAEVDEMLKAYLSDTDGMEVIFKSTTNLNEVKL